MTLHQITGELVNVLIDKKMESGFWEVEWDLTGQDQGKVPPGMYIADSTTSNINQTVKVLVVGGNRGLSRFRVLIAIHRRGDDAEVRNS